MARVVLTLPRGGEVDGQARIECWRCARASAKALAGVPTNVTAAAQAATWRRRSSSRPTRRPNLRRCVRSRPMRAESDELPLLAGPGGPTRESASKPGTSSGRAHEVPVDRIDAPSEGSTPSAASMGEAARWRPPRPAKRGDRGPLRGESCMGAAASRTSSVAGLPRTGNQRVLKDNSRPRCRLRREAARRRRIVRVKLSTTRSPSGAELRSAVADGAQSWNTAVIIRRLVVGAGLGRVRRSASDGLGSDTRRQGAQSGELTEARWPERRPTLVSRRGSSSFLHLRQYGPRTHGRRQTP